jgi:hypothetical protein
MLSKRKHIDVKILPSQGFFYESDFKIHIKRAEDEDIADYENEFNKENIGAILNKLKMIVERNTIIRGNYDFNHIRSIDVVYLFLEIVKFTKNKSIIIEYWDDENGTNNSLEFSTENFNYFELDENLLESWNTEFRSFDINGYKYKLPSIGIENSVTAYLIEKSYEQNAEKFNEYNYNFTYFLGNKDILSFQEIENLIQIFNFDIDREERILIDKIVSNMNPIQKYSLRKGKRVIDLNAKLNLEKIWK